MKSMSGTKNPCITSVDSSVTCTDRPSGTAIVSGLPLLVAVAVLPLTAMPSLTYLADHCHWDPVTTSRSAGCGAMASTLFTVTSPNESSRMTMASGAAKNVTRAPLFPRVCTGSDSSPRRLRYRTMTMASMAQTNTNTGIASQRMMNQRSCTSCAFGSSPVFTRPQPDAASGSVSSSARRSARRGPPDPRPLSPGRGLACTGLSPGRELSGTGSRPLSSGVIRCDIITSSGSGELRDHADGHVRRAGAAAGLAGLPARRHVGPGRQIHRDRGAGVGGQWVAAVGVVDPVILGVWPVLLGVGDHVLGGLASREPQHHVLVVDLERLLVDEPDDDRLVRRHARRHAVVGEVLHEHVVRGGRARASRGGRGGGGGERRDHADGHVRRAGAAAGLAGLPARRHVVPGR